MLPSSSLCVAVFLFVSLGAQANAQPADPAESVCPRPDAGAYTSNPPELRSRHGVLEATLTFKMAVDVKGKRRYCYMSESGLLAPTLRVNPGDTLIIHFRNEVPSDQFEANRPAGHTHSMTISGACDSREMSDSSTNLHFHGLYVKPTCHQDDVLRTAIAAGSVFNYRISIPKNHPPGVYWYHPHLHGSTQEQLQGGASGALIVEGAQAVNPQLSGLPERILVIRDQALTTPSKNGEPTAPAWDLSVNYIPVLYPQYEPAKILVKPGERQFWRVVNAAANTILDLQILANGANQPVQVFSIDGVPIRGGLQSKNEVLLGPGARVEFVMKTPESGEATQLVTRKWDTGPAGDSDPARPLANIVADRSVHETRLLPMSKRNFPPLELVGVKPTVERHLYLAERVSQEKDDDGPPSAVDDDANTRFYVFFGGEMPALFDMNAPPNISVHQGTVEDWTITNTTLEDHVFHIHQLHFAVLESDGTLLHEPEIRDTINIPHRTPGKQPPSVKLRMDFRGPDLVGTFIYQCHIIAHTEAGMMATIQVLPRGVPSSVVLTSFPNPQARQLTTVTASVRSLAQRTRSPLTGTVQFSIDGLAEGGPTPIKSGKASRVLLLYRPGVHSVSAIYSGDRFHEASQAQTITIAISQQ